MQTRILTMISLLAFSTMVLVSSEAILPAAHAQTKKSPTKKRNRNYNYQKKKSTSNAKKRQYNYKKNNNSNQSKTINNSKKKSTGKYVPKKKYIIKKKINNNHKHDNHKHNANKKHDNHKKHDAHKHHNHKGPNLHLILPGIFGPTHNHGHNHNHGGGPAVIIGPGIGGPGVGGPGIGGPGSPAQPVAPKLPVFGIDSFNMKGVGDRVTSVKWKGLGDRLNLAPGDIIISLNGYPLNYKNAWHDGLSRAVKQGNTITLEVKNSKSGVVTFRSLDLSDPKAKAVVKGVPQSQSKGQPSETKPMNTPK